MMFNFSANLMFFSLNAFEMIGFFALALNWPELMQCWQMAESLLMLQNRSQKSRFILKIRVIASTVLLLALSNSLTFVKKK